MKTRIFGQLGALLGDIGRAHAASRAYERLSAMCDERLAARGLARGDIAAAAYREAFDS